MTKAADDIEDFALLRSSGVPTYHMASCADDADLKITHILRGQEHLANTFKHILIFEALGFPLPQFAHLPLLIAPDGVEALEAQARPGGQRDHLREAGFLPQAFVNFVSLRGWSPKDDREVMSRQEMIEAFSLEGINHSNAMVNFTEEDPFDPESRLAERRAHQANSPSTSSPSGYCRSPRRRVCPRILAKCRA